VYIDNKVWLLRFFENYAGYMFDIGILSVERFFFCFKRMFGDLFVFEKSNKQRVNKAN